MSESDFIISQFIDDELTLEEKREFVQKCHGEDAFREEALLLLEQEKVLRSERPVPPFRTSEVEGRSRSFRTPRPMTVIAAVLALAVLGLSGLLSRRPARTEPALQQVTPVLHRFVLHEPFARQVEIAGSFTNWQKVALEPLRESGYWEITLELPPGVHRYAYILDGSRRAMDPTVPASEQDDFGGQNSVLMTGRKL